MEEKKRLVQMKRVSRACYNCRRRKSKCDLDSNGRPPCKRCHNERLQCELGTSNRGGKRVRKSVVSSTLPPSVVQPVPPVTVQRKAEKDTASPQSYHYSPYNNNTNEDDDADDSSESTSESAIGAGVPGNPSDAWQRLTNVAKRTVEPSVDLAPTARHLHPNSRRTNLGIAEYRLVADGQISREDVLDIIARYAQNYHCYFPLVPRRYFDPTCLDQFAANEKHLLTAVLTIASKDKSPEIHQACSKYMLELIAGIAAGIDCDVEAVEALLILAEWEPQGLRPSIEPVGRGEEDRAAWMHVGIALRSGYFLGLDKTSFRGDSNNTDAENRRRLAWASCYVSDRLISVRIGRAFWSRGPGPMTGLVSHDFPSLQPQGPGEEDYSKIFQAILDLTQLYGNVHDVLYSGMRTSRNMMLMGDYVKYVDDFRVAISRWYRLWGNMKSSPHLNVMLQMSYEYLKLYTNAFAFQAAISQALHKPKSDTVSQRDHLRAAFNNVASMQDSRFIYESVEAARAYLTIFTNFVDPERHLHYMPLRFYLYSIYAAVFLYKARSFGVMNQSEEGLVRKKIDETIDSLRRASTSPDDVGFRYARLLELLWKPKTAVSTNGDLYPPSTANPADAHPIPNSNPVLHPPIDAVDASTAAAAAAAAEAASASAVNVDNLPPLQDQPPLSSSLPEPPYMQFSPANDFSWLDLTAVNNFVSGDGPIIGIESFQGLEQGLPPAHPSSSHGAHTNNTHNTNNNTSHDPDAGSGFPHWSGYLNVNEILLF